MKCFVAGVLACGILLGGCSNPPSPREQASQENKMPYTQPLISSGAAFAALPPAVQNTVRATTGSAGIERVIKTNRMDQVAYEIQFEDKELYPTLYVAGDGTLLNRDLTPATGGSQGEAGVLSGGVASGLSPEELPSPVAKVLRDQNTSGSVQSVTRQTWGNQVVYIIHFKNQPESSSLYINSDGQILREGAH
jgi:hypothetical protein